MNRQQTPRFTRREASPRPAAPAGAPERLLSPAEFRGRLFEASARFARLRHDGASGLDAGSVASRALAELDVAWEELNVADEEMRVQCDELDVAATKIGQERERYREFFDFAPDPYVVTDALGKILAANRASTGLLNVPAHKLPGRFLVSFVRLSERAAMRARINAVVAGRGPIRWECTLAPPGRRDPPREVEAAVTAAPGREGGVLWTLRDITEKRRRGEAVGALDEDLERRVVERTRELGASRLDLEALLSREREARLELERAGREREEFLALVSHELRSPLHAMLGWAGLAADSDEPQALRKALRVVEHNGRAMASLVDELLDVARVGRRELVLARDRVELGGLLAALCDSLQPNAAARMVSLGFEPAGGHWPAVEGDKMRLEQVFTNLIVNALKFTPAGGQVSVRLAREGGLSVVRVADTGQGIAPSLLPHIFERYRQGDGGPQGSGRGLGLGLALAWYLVASHGGSVRAESEGEGKGSCFTVCLPAVDVAAPGGV